MRITLATAVLLTLATPAFASQARHVHHHARHQAVQSVACPKFVERRTVIGDCI